MPSVMTQSIPRTDENIGHDRQAIQTEENTLSDSHTSEQSPLDSSLNESLPEKVESDRLDDKMTCVNSDAPSSPNASVTEVLDSVDSIAADPTIAPPVSLVMPQQSNTSVSSQSYGVASHPPLFGEHVIQISQFKKNMGMDKLHDKHDTDYDADNEATPPVQTKVQNLSPIPESEESSELGSSFCDNSPSTATEELKCVNSTSRDESNVSVDWSIETQCGSEVPSISQSISSINQTSLSDGILADDEEDEEVVIFDIRKRKEYMEEIAKEEAGEQAQESSCESSYTANAGDQDSSINDEESSIDGYSTNELSALFKLIRDVTNVSVDDGSGSDDNSDGIETTEGSEAVYKYDHLEENCENATPLVGVEGSEGGIDGPLDQLIKLIETLFPQCADEDITVDSSYRSDDENVEEIQLHKDTFTADTENKDCTETRLISDSDNNIQSLKFCDQELCNHAAFNLPGPDEFQTSSEFWEINAEKLLFTARQDVDSDLDSSRSPQGFLAPQEGEKLDDSDDAQIKLLEFEQVPDSLQNKAETDIHCDSRDSKEDDASEEECKTEGDLCQETDQFHLEDLESRFLDDNDEETSSEWSLDISYNLEDGISNSSSDPEDYIIMLQSDLPNEDSDDQFQLALDSFSFTETSDSDEYSDMEEYFTKTGQKTQRWSLRETKEIKTWLKTQGSSQNAKSACLITPWIGQIP
ncbi:uro-adherence factor A-like [Ptychodera flava]|uniref:uro-adherence factor A-like n=1 Tax=Ptychodera flava TaxID=63121 RepID=UPI00396A76E8